MAFLQNILWVWGIWDWVTQVGWYVKNICQDGPAIKRRLAGKVQHSLQLHHYDSYKRATPGMTPPSVWVLTGQHSVLIAMCFTSSDWLGKSNGEWSHWFPWEFVYISSGNSVFPSLFIKWGWENLIGFGGPYLVLFMQSISPCLLQGLGLIACKNSQLVSELKQWFLWQELGFPKAVPWNTCILRCSLERGLGFKEMRGDTILWSFLLFIAWFSGPQIARLV